MFSETVLLQLLPWLNWSNIGTIIYRYKRNPNVKYKCISIIYTPIYRILSLFDYTQVTLYSWLLL